MWLTLNRRAILSLPLQNVSDNAPLGEPVGCIARKGSVCHFPGKATDGRFHDFRVSGTDDQPKMVVRGYPEVLFHQPQIHSRSHWIRSSRSGFNAKFCPLPWKPLRFCSLPSEAEQRVPGHRCTLDSKRANPPIRNRFGRAHSAQAGVPLGPENSVIEPDATVPSDSDVLPNCHNICFDLQHLPILTWKFSTSGVNEATSFVFGGNKIRAILSSSSKCDLKN